MAPKLRTSVDTAPFRHHGLAFLEKLVIERYSKYMESTRHEELAKHPFVQGELIDAITLMFVMEDNYNKSWEFDKGEWISSSKKRMG